MNNVELYLFKILLIKSNYDKYRLYLKDVFDVKHPLGKLFKHLDLLYKNHIEDLSLQDYNQSFFSNNAFLKKEDLEFYTQVLDRVSNIELKDETVSSILTQYKKKEVASEIARTALDVAEGNKKAEEKLQILYDDMFSEDKLNLEKQAEEQFVTTSLSSILDRQLHSTGLEWRLQCLNESIGPLRKGYFGFVFARPETGKTTFLASEVSNFLDQVDKPVLWFNNEQQGEEVMLRVYQAVFGKTLNELEQDPNRYEKVWREKYEGRLKMVDSSSIHRNYIYKLCQQQEPSLIIFDQIDKIKGFGDDRNDLLLGEIYIWARELAKEFAPVIGICQAGGTGENKMWLDMGDVVNAKTAKQAEADWILGIGAVHDSQTLRYLNISKNKCLGGPMTRPESRHGRFTTIIKPEVGRYEDV